MACAGLELAFRHSSDRKRLFGRRKLKKPCCYINPDSSVKMSDASEHPDSEFYYQKINK